MRDIKLPKIFQPFTCDGIVRLGKANDGGYLVDRQDVIRSRSLISFGVGEDVSFEEGFTRMNPCPVVAYDDTHHRHPDFFHGDRKHILSRVGPGGLRSVIDEVGDGAFLKCDIDGGEYGMITELIEASKHLTGIAIEFHDVHLNENFNDLTNLISKVEQRLIHIHVNNYSYIKFEGGGFMPQVLELSFSSSSDLRYDPSLALPHPLDMPNNPSDDDFRITF